MNDLLKSIKFHVALGFIPVVLGIIGFFYLAMFWSEIHYNYLYFLLIGVVVFFGLAYVVRWANKRLEDLKKNGQLVKGKILYISLELTSTGSSDIKRPFEKYSAGRFHFYKLACTVPGLSEGEKGLFVSDALQFRPIVSPGTDIDIYLDRNKPHDNYWVDITKVAVDTSLNSSKVMENLGITDFGKSSGFYKSYDGINFKQA